MTQDGNNPLEGGCLCGAVRYRIDGPLQGEIAHCHCTMCRRASGALAVTWATARRDDFSITKGEPSRHRSSDKGERTHCPTCGAQLTFAHADHPDTVDVTLGTLDDPENHPATLHIHTASRIPWMRLDRHLPDRPREEEG